MANKLRKTRRLADYSKTEHTYNEGYLQALMDNNLMVPDNIYDWFQAVYMSTDIYKGLTEYTYVISHSPLAARSLP